MDEDFQFVKFQVAVLAALQALLVFAGNMERRYDNEAAGELLQKAAMNLNTFFEEDGDAGA